MVHSFQSIINLRDLFSSKRLVPDENFSFLRRLANAVTKNVKIIPNQLKTTTVYAALFLCFR